MDYITIKTESNFGDSVVSDGNALIFLKNDAGVFSLGLKGADGLFYTISNKSIEDRVTALEEGSLGISAEQADEIAFNNSIIFG